MKSSQGKTQTETQPTHYQLIQETTTTKQTQNKKKQHIISSS